MNEKAVLAGIVFVTIGIIVCTILEARLGKRVTAVYVEEFAKINLGLSIEDVWKAASKRFPDGSDEERVLTNCINYMNTALIPDPQKAFSRVERVFKGKKIKALHKDYLNH